MPGWASSIGYGRPVPATERSHTSLWVEHQVPYSSGAMVGQVATSVIS
ncbi:MAG: hypothetical protein RJA70_2616 [Pseudomonadota bacterium]|jgi:hypothetical protein